jgi:formate hydrogenlyase subunit 3/multisubunit Na+/H+ antiporter MnhD subunit
MWPVAGILVILLAGGRHARTISLVMLSVGVLIAGGIAGSVWQSGHAIIEIAGGWLPPLGILLLADGLSAAMMLLTSVVLLAAAIYAPAEFRVGRGKPETRRALTFWILLMAVWVAMNAVFLGNDLFNLYVALELVTFAGVPLVCLSGSPATLSAAMRYLLFALIGSVLYLLGIVIIYAVYGTLDLGLLSEVARPEPALFLAMALMTAGLAAKTALFPLHIWLPPAHSGAPPAASALLSALVVKGSFFLTLRLWFDLAPGLLGIGAGQILGAMGAGAIVVGGVMAIRQTRLKLLVAYSTVAQIGYLFLMFPMAALGPGSLAAELALAGGMFQAMAHAFAKASMFMAAGLMAEVLGNDRLEGLGGIARVMPVTAFAFVLAAASLVGVPPTGGFFAKWLLISASMESGQWWWAGVIFAGGLLAGGYMYRAVNPIFAGPDQSGLPVNPISRSREMAVLALAILALLLGMFPGWPMELMKIGRPHYSEVSVP